MPDDDGPITVNELDADKLVFLSKWLGKNAIISSGLAKRLRRKMVSKKKVREFQTNIKEQYVIYVNKKNEVETKARALRTDFAGYWDEMDDLRIRFEGVEGDIVDIDSTVVNAQADDPKFDWGTDELVLRDIRLSSIRDRARQTAQIIDARMEALADEVRIKTLQDKLLERILAAKTSLSALENLDDQGTLSPALIKQGLGDVELDGTRSSAVDGLAAAHGALKVKLTELRVAAGAEDVNEDTLVTLGAELSTALDACEIARAPFIETLLELVEDMRDAALDALAELAASDPVAGREVVRQDKIDRTTENLGRGIDALAVEIATLTQKLADAEGFKEKQRLAKQIGETRDQKAALEQRRTQLAAYEKQAADRLEKIKEIKFEAAEMNLVMAGIRDGRPSTEEALQAYLDTKPDGQRVFPEVAPSDSDSSAYRAEAIKNIEADKVTYLASSRTIASDAILFLGEPQVTQINDAQLATLNMILDNAITLAGQGKYSEAALLRQDAAKLHLKFKGSRSFALPPPPVPPVDPFEAFDRTLKSVSVLLDKHWGKGGDTDGALRARLDEVKALRDAQTTETPPDLSAADTALASLESDILDADIPAVDPAIKEADDAAKVAAHEKVDAIKRELLVIHDAREITDLSRLANIPADHVLTIEGADGEKKFYEIGMKEASDSALMVDKRGAGFKDVPRAEMAKLREKMQTLEMLAELETPGSAALIEAATVEAQEMLDQVKDGDAYKAAKDAIKAVDDYLAKKSVRSIYAEWRPEGYGADLDAFDKLKSGWEGSKKPADVVSAVEAFLAKFEGPHKIAAEKLRTDHAAATEKLDRIELDLSANKKGTEANVGAKIAQLTKMTPEELLRGNIINLNGKSDAEQEALRQATETIRTSLAYLKTADKNFAGAQGKSRETLMALRKELETRSQPTVDQVINKADRLIDELSTALVALEKMIAEKGTNPEAFLLGLARFLGEARAGTETATADAADVIEQKRLCKEERAKVKDWIDDNVNKTRHRNYKEYKSIFDGLETAYKAIGKNLETSHDNKRAAQEYKDSAKNWRDLHADVTDTQKESAGEWFFDFDGTQAKIRASVAKISAAAAKVQQMLTEKFADDDRREDDEAQAAVAAVNQVLALCQGDKNGFLVLDGTAKTKLANLKDPQHQMGQLPDKEKKAIVGQLREETLRQLRRIRTRLESDPAFEIYRNNPMDRGQTWVQLTATLLNFETTILKNLAP
ncbi:hypothetical protein OS190_13350 [Sulfitobacter sp. F26204]|uniref:hypothetical protein n=1 Tax=Sulfitobacter sp. F26204 TaxID=2996014 RepID=UPI00225E3FBB|nr:hypothetical protein [Sulfitobacter sp. F26204]MCX7560557.1 hypothetical protein [Sulfitobacter sp. F26204]